MSGKSHSPRKPRPVRVLASAAAAAALAGSTAVAPAGTKDWNAAGGLWATSANWLPTGLPGGTDSVLIGSTSAAANGTVAMNTNPTIASLAVTDGMTLDTVGFVMLVGTNATVSGRNDAGSISFPSRLIVRGNGAAYGFKTIGNLSITDRARFESIAGTTEVGGLLSIDGTSTLAGTGTINLTGGAATAMTLDGALEVDVGSLTINQVGAGRIDLDGNAVGDRRIDVTAGDFLNNRYASLVINGVGLADDFNDAIRIGGRNTVNMNLSNGWTMSGGTIEFGSNIVDPGPGVLAGGTLTMNGAMAVIGANSSGLVSAPATINPVSRVTVNAGNKLTFAGPTTVNGGSFTVAQGGQLLFGGPTTVKGGAFRSFSTTTADGSIVFGGDTTYAGTVSLVGVASQNGDATVTSPTVINAEVFDLDGFSGTTTWNANALLTINAGTVETTDSAQPAFNGTMNVNYVGGIIGTQGALALNLPPGQHLQMAGTLNLGGSPLGFASTTLSGAPVDVLGRMTVGYNHVTASRLTVKPGGKVSILNLSSLRLEGGNAAAPNLIEGGVIEGPGALLASAGRRLSGFGTISANVNFDTGADIVADGGTLTLSGPISHAGGLVAAAGGVLNVVNPWNTNVATSLGLSGGRVSGGTITNGGLTNNGTLGSAGTISTAGFVNDGTLGVTGGAVTLDTVAAPDLDGAGSSGRINVTAGGALRVTRYPTDTFDGAAMVDTGTLQLDHGWIVGSGATLSLSGSAAMPARLTGGGLQFVYGAVNVTGRAEIDIPTGFEAGSTVTVGLSDQLTLRSTTAVVAGATFAGAGTLRNAPGALLSPFGGSSANVYVENSGRLAVAGDGTLGIASVKLFSQKPDGELDIDIGGPVAGTQHDRLIATGAAFTEGKLSLALRNGYDPSYLLPHEIFHSGGQRTLNFSTISGFVVSPTKYLAVTYDTDSVLVTAALPGDANLDGSVNIGDFALLAAGFNKPGTWSSGNFNGDATADIGDFSLLATNFNTSIPGGVPAFALSGGGDRASAVPEPGCSVFVLGAGLQAFRRRRLVRAGSVLPLCPANHP